MSLSTTMAPHSGVYIDGRWLDGEEGAQREVRSPWDGSLIATTTDATSADVEAAAAMAGSRAAQEPLSPYARFEILSRAANLVEARREELTETIVAEAGKPVRDARHEVIRTVQTLRLCGEEAKRLGGEVIPMEATPGSEHRIGFTLPTPLGPVCAITPFNVPLSQISHKVPTALAAGCPVVLKPAELTPLSAIEFVQILHDAGLPAGWLGLVLGGPEVGQKLLESPHFNAYTFTGSVSVGRHIHNTVGLRKTILELGNNSPTIVHRDADLALAADRVVVSAFKFAGQLCTSAQRVIVHADVHARFVELLAERAENLVVGDPADEATDVGPMITASAAHRAEKLIADTVDDGATLLVGGSRSGQVIAPTVLDGVTQEMTIAQHEAFAPVVALLGYRALDEAVAIANGTRYGLQAAVFTESIDVAIHLGRRIHAGTVMVNEGSHVRLDQMPFGGLKDSGLGREGVRYAVAEFTAPRLIAVSTRVPQ